MTDESESKYDFRKCEAEQRREMEEDAEPGVRRLSKLYMIILEGFPADPPLTPKEEEIKREMLAEREKARKEGRKIVFMIPND